MIKEEEKKHVEEKRYKLLENLYLYAATQKSLKESVSTQF